MVFNKSPVELAMRPLPMPEMTPPLTRTYFILTGKENNKEKGKMQVAVAGCCQAGRRRRKKDKSRGVVEESFACSHKFPAGRKKQRHSFANAQTRKVPKNASKDKTIHS
jgi:hypothetical protein